MNTHADKTQGYKSQSVANFVSKKQDGGEPTFQFVDNRPEAVAQRKSQEMVNNSQQVSQLMDFQNMANKSPQAKQPAQLKAMANNNSAQQQPIQNKENNPGLPEKLKTGLKDLSGYSMGDVKVHYDFDKPAEIQSHAYAQGTEVVQCEGFVVSKDNDTHVHYWGKGDKEGHLKVNSETYNLQDKDELKTGINILGGIINGYMDKGKLSSVAQKKLKILQTILASAMKYYNTL